MEIYMMATPLGSLVKVVLHVRTQVDPPWWMDSAGTCRRSMAWDGRIGEYNPGRLDWKNLGRHAVPNPNRICFIEELAARVACLKIPQPMDQRAARQQPRPFRWAGGLFVPI